MRTSIYLFILLVALCVPAVSQPLQNIKIYINPGHGGHDADDRNVVIAPFAPGDPNGFWESNSNLDKGLRLRDLLLDAGASVIMSRTTNTSADDRNLTVIAQEANINNVDFMISIHSNAHNGTVNYPLMLFHGWDNNPLIQASLDLANLFWENLISNNAGHWTNTNRTVRGDKSFAPESWNGYGVLRPLTVPGLISEGAFHDYIPETYRLMNIDYKHLEAWHFYKAFLKYYANTGDPHGKIAGYIRDNLTKVTAYYSAPNSPDQLLPLNGATITLNPGNKKYTVDNMNNGFFIFDNLEPGQYSLSVENNGYHAISLLDIPVNSNTVTYKNITLQQVRDQALKVLSYSPNVNSNETVNAGTTIDFVFNYELNRASFEEAFSITPTVDGIFTYSDQDRQVSFIPNTPLEKSTLYQVRIDKSAKHVGDLSMEEDFIFSFTTANRNKLTITKHFPIHNQSGVSPNTLIRIYFDRAIKTEKLTTQINITDSSGKTISKSAMESNTAFGDLGSVTFRAMNLTPGMEYTVSIDGDLQDIDNLPLGSPLSFNFSVDNLDSREGVLLDDFEISQMQLSPIHSINVDETKSFTNIYSSIKMSGKYSQRILYNLKSSNSILQVNYVTPSISVNKDQCLGMYVWGDFSMSNLSVMISKSGLSYEMPITEIDFGGWQYKTVNLRNLPFEGDGIIEGFRLSSDDNSLSQYGFILLDKMISFEEQSTDVKEIDSESNRVYILPNPVRSKFKIMNTTDKSMIRISITDLSGNVILRQQDMSTNDLIDVSNLRPGMYMLVINTTKNIHTVKFQKIGDH